MDLSGLGLGLGLGLFVRVVRFEGLRHHCHSVNSDDGSVKMKEYIGNESDAKIAD
jgi:hypothetical protein